MAAIHWSRDSYRPIGKLGAIPARYNWSLTLDQHNIMLVRKDFVFDDRSESYQSSVYFGSGMQFITIEP